MINFVSFKGWVVGFKYQDVGMSRYYRFFDFGICIKNYILKSISDIRVPPPPQAIWVALGPYLIKNPIYSPYYYLFIY